MNQTDENAVVRLARRAVADERHRRSRQEVPTTMRVLDGVAALIVVERDFSYLSRTLAAVLSQTALPSELLILHADHRFDGSQSWTVPFDLAGSQMLVRVCEEPKATSFGAQVSFAVNHGRVPSSARLLWLLHDDSRPASSHVLSDLVESFDKAPGASIVGAKQLDWEGDGLQDVGWLLDRHGRRASLTVDGEQDQSQYDNRQDVLGVSLAGAIVSKKIWQDCGGVDPWMGSFAESTDFCRRVWRLGKRVIVQPKAAIRHARARYSGLRADDGSHRRRAQPSSLQRLEAAEKLAMTNTHGLALLFAFLWSILRAIGLFAADLFRKQPRRAFAMLAIPWLRLAYLPRRLSPRRSYSRTAISARRYPALVATHRQMKDWKLRRRSFRAQGEGELLNPIAAAHLRYLARHRAVDCLLLAVLGLAVMFSVSAPLLPTLFAGGTLSSSVLAPTAATASQAFEAGTLMWTRAIGIGMVGAPLPFDLVLGLLALIGGGHLAIGITVFWLISLSVAMLSMYALVGIVTRSRALRMVFSIVWGGAAFMLGVVQAASLPLLVVMCFLPLSFYFVFRAVGWYAVDEPRTVHPSVQAAALASLFMAIVTLSEPQLILPFVLAFLLYLFAVKEHKAMLLLMPVPSIVALAPTFYYVLFRAREGAWRQLFADALVPERGWSDPSAVIRRQIDVARAGLPRWMTAAALIALCAVAVLLLLCALFSLFVRSSRRMSRMAWTPILSGAGLLAIAPRIAVAPAIRPGQKAITASCVPALVFLVLGLLLAASALTGMNNALFRATVLAAAPDPGASTGQSSAREAPVSTLSSRRTPLRGLRGLICALLLMGVALTGTASGLAWSHASTVDATGQALPIVAASDLRGQKRRILAVRADGDDSLRYWVMSTGSGDLIDASPMASAWLLDHSDPVESAIGTAAAGLLSGGADAASSLASLGFIGIYVPPAGPSASKTVRQARTTLAAHVLSADGTIQVTNTPRDGLYARLSDAGSICAEASGHDASARLSSAASSPSSTISVDGGISSQSDADLSAAGCPSLRRASKGLAAARTDPQRIIWLVLLAAVLVIYLIVAIPRSRHLSSEEGR